MIKKFKKVGSFQVKAARLNSRGVAVRKSSRKLVLEIISYKQNKIFVNGQITEKGQMSTDRGPKAVFPNQGYQALSWGYLELFQNKNDEAG